MKNTAAVLSGDVVSSSRLSAPQRKELEALLWQELERFAGDKNNFVITRGDAFQLLPKNPKDALAIAIELRCILKKNFNTDKGSMIDARISIGLGEIQLHGKTLSSSDGSAFRLSGRGLDNLESGELHLAISTGEPLTDAVLETICILADVHIRAWNKLQAEAVLGRLQNLTYEQLGEKLGINPSAAYKRIESAQWKLIPPVLQYFEFLVETLSKPPKDTPA